jgi:hypothetical protein
MSVFPALVRGERTHQMVSHFPRHRLGIISSQFRVFGAFRGDFICIGPAEN